MCYSAMVEQSRSKLERIFEAKSDERAFEAFRGVQALEQSMSPQEMRSVLGLARAPKVSQFRWAPVQPDAPAVQLSEGDPEHVQRVQLPDRHSTKPAGMEALVWTDTRALPLHPVLRMSGRR